MCLKPTKIESIPEETVRIAKAAFPKGNLYLKMRDELGTIFSDLDFMALYPSKGQPAFSPWRLALITVLQFLENLSDRQAADAVRSRIDWKYALGLELTDMGFDYSVLSGFRQRLLANQQETLLFEKLLALLVQKNLLKARGKQRTDSTHVLASIRVMNRLELVVETLRATLNELATFCPDWLKSITLTQWFDRYCLRAEQSKLPYNDKAKEEFAVQVGMDGYYLLQIIKDQQPELLKLPKVDTLAKVWQRHYSRNESNQVIWVNSKELPRAATAIESPYDTQAKHSSKRDIIWTGYKAHLSESCDDGLPRIITNVYTTVATQQDVASTANIQQSMADKNLLPSRHLVDAGYVDAELVIESQQKYNVQLFGPTRLNPSWQSREGAYDSTQFQVDWEKQIAVCPEGKHSPHWYEYRTKNYQSPVTKIKFSQKDCQDCLSRYKCVRSKTNEPRSLQLPSKSNYLALEQTRQLLLSEFGKEEYKKRAGVEGTLSQAVRIGSLRRSRYIGLQKTHLQELALASGINILRTVNFLNDVPLAKTRISRFAKLAA
jgi:transposase